MKHFLKSSMPHIMLIAFVFCAPLLQGLSSKEYFYVFMFFLSALGTFTIIASKKLLLDIKILSFLLLQAAIGGISIFNALNKGAALYGFFLSFLPPLVFLLVLNAERFRDKILAAIFISGCITALINFKIMSDLDSITENLVRLDRVIPYANTLAIFLFVCSVIGINLCHIYSDSFWKAAAIRCGACITVTAMIFTYSRAVWVLGLGLYVLNTLLHRSARHFLNTGAVILISFAFTAIISYSNWLLLYPALIFVLLISAVCQIPFTRAGKYSADDRRVTAPSSKFHLSGLSCANDETGRSASRASIPNTTVIHSQHQKTTGKSSRAKFLAMYAASAILAVIIPAAMFMLLKNTAIIERLSSIALNASELQERFAYYRDAWDIIGHYPVTGTGPGGWASIQYKYQTALYAAKYVHSSVLQVVLDYGFPGLALFASQILLFMVYSVRAMKRAVFCSSKSIAVSLFICPLSILLHSFIDIDFEFPVILLIFWVFMALLSYNSGSAREIPIEKKSWRLSAAALPLAIMLLLIPVASSYMYYLKALDSVNKRDYSQAELHFQKSIKLNPFSSNTYHSYGGMLETLYKTKPGETLKQQCIEYYTQAEKLDNENPRYTAGRLRVFKLAKDYDSCIREYEKLISLQPLVIQYYEELAEILCTRGEQLFSSEKPAQAAKYFQKVVDLEAGIENAAQKASAYAYQSRHKVRLKVTPPMAYNIGKAYVYLTQQTKAKKYFAMYYGKNLTSEQFMDVVEKIKHKGAAH